MAVLVEAISVIVRREAIAERFSGGWQRFLAIVPNRTLCSDENLARVGFMSPPDVAAFISRLEQGGLTFVHDGRALDIAVVDQMRGPTIPAEWLEFGPLSFDETGYKVSACWLQEGPRIATGIHVPAKPMTLATPHDWSYANSLSAQFTFVENEQMQNDLEFLRHEDGMDVYLERSSGKKVYVGRPKG